MTSTPSRTLPARHVVVVRKEHGEVLDIRGLRIEVIEDGSNTDYRIGAVNITVPPHTKGPPQHWHQMHDETFLVTAGTVTFASRDQTIALSEGDYIVVPPMSPHTFSNDTDTEARMYNSFTPAFYIDFFRTMAQMSADNGGVMTPELTREAMGRYATLQTREMGQPW